MGGEVSGNSPELNNTKRMSRIIFFLLLLPLIVSCASGGPNHKTMNSLADLSGATLGVMTGTCYDITYSDRADLTVARYNTIADLIAALQQGRIDCFVSEEFVINNDVCRENRLKKAFCTEESFPCSFAFRKSDQSLVDSMSVMIREMRASGELEALTGKWLNGSNYSSIPMAHDGQPLPTGKPLVVGVCENLAPLLFTVGQEWRGMEPELLRMLGYRVGRPAEFRYMDFSAMSAALQTGAIDIMASGIFVTEERQKIFLFPEPYIECRGAFFVMDDDRTSDVGFWDGIKRSFNNNLLIENRWKFLADGLLVTIEITLLSILFGSILGAGLYLMRRNRRNWVKRTANVYGDILRGIPVVVLLMILFYVVLRGSL